MEKNEEKLTENFVSYSKEFANILANQKCLNEGASENELIKLKETFGLKTHSEIIELYLIANGQSESAECLPFLINGYHFLSIERALDEYRMMQEVSLSESDFAEWNKMHLPFASDYAGNFLVIDLNGSIDKVDWTVFGYELEDDNIPLAKSLSDFFKIQSLILQNDDYYIEDNLLFSK